MCKITFTCPFVCMILHSIIADAAILRDQCHPYNHINFFQEQGNGHPSIFYGPPRAFIDWKFFTFS